MSLDLFIALLTAGFVYCRPSTDLLQALMIIGLLLRRARERKSELRLLESEKRFRLMADTTPALVWMCDREGKVTYLNDRRIRLHRPRSGDGTGGRMVGIHTP